MILYIQGEMMLIMFLGLAMLLGAQPYAVAFAQVCMIFRSGS